MTRATGILAGVLLLVAGAIGAAFIAWHVPDQPVSALQARWAPPPSQFIAVRGMQVHVRDEGPRDDPVPIILLHGTGASLHTWDGWTRELARERRVIRFDLPGFGLTGPSPDGVYTVESYVDTVLAVADKLGVQRFVLAGNSLGGYVAWATAVLHPPRRGTQPARRLRRPVQRDAGARRPVFRSGDARRQPGRAGGPPRPDGPGSIVRAAR